VRRRNSRNFNGLGRKPRLSRSPTKQHPNLHQLQQVLAHRNRDSRAKRLLRQLQRVIPLESAFRREEARVDRVNGDVGLEEEVDITGWKVGFA